MKKALTAKFVESVKPAAKRQVFTDTVTNNLMLIVQPSGAKTWAWQGRMDGLIKKITLGQFPAHDLAAARQWATEITEKRDLGINIIEQRAQEAKAEEVASARTCDWLFDLYMEHDGSRHKSATMKRQMYDRDIQPAIGHRVVETITKRDLEDLLEAKLNAGFPSASNHMQVLIARWWKWAVTKGSRHTDLEYNPAQNLVKMAEENSRDRFLSDYEIGLFFRTLVACPTPLNDALTLILYTGVRRAEAIGAEWKEFDWRRGAWIIPKDRTKNGDELVLPLQREMLDYLTARREALDAAEEKGAAVCELVWSTDAGKPITALGKPIKRLNEKMAELAAEDGKTVERWTIHDLRRTLSSGMHGLHDEEEKPLINSDIVERVINHKIGGVRGIYNRWGYLAEKRAALRIWADHLATLKPNAVLSS